MKRMTDQFAYLTPAAIREIIGHIDQSIGVFDNFTGKLDASEIQVKSMLVALRRQLIEQLSRRMEDVD